MLKAIKRKWYVRKWKKAAPFGLLHRANSIPGTSALDQTKLAKKLLSDIEATFAYAPTEQNLRRRQLIHFSVGRFVHQLRTMGIDFRNFKVIYPAFSRDMAYLTVRHSLMTLRFTFHLPVALSPSTKYFNHAHGSLLCRISTLLLIQDQDTPYVTKARLEIPPELSVYANGIEGPGGSTPDWQRYVDSINAQAQKLYIETWSE